MDTGSTSAAKSRASAGTSCARRCRDRRRTASAKRLSIRRRSAVRRSTWRRSARHSPSRPERPRRPDAQVCQVGASHRAHDRRTIRRYPRGHPVLSRAFPLLSIVVLLFPMGVFMLGSPPLLILKHDTPVDGRFIRGLFNLYYISVITVATV